VRGCLSKISTQLPAPARRKEQKEMQDMAKLRSGSPRPLMNSSKRANTDLSEYLLLAVLIALVVGTVVVYVAHRWAP
jgi:hypothetical protein